MIDQATLDNLRAAYVAFKAKMDALRQRRLAWMGRVVARIEQEKIAQLRTSLKS